MTIIEAIKSGKRFRRPDGDFIDAIDIEFVESNGITLDDSMFGLAHLNYEDLLADDWEIEEETIEITKSQLEKILFESVGSYKAHESAKKISLGTALKRFKSRKEIYQAFGFKS